MQRHCKADVDVARRRVGRRGLQRLANMAADFAEMVVGVANDFAPLQGDWVQLSPYGQFPHARGMQYFAKTDAETLVNSFNSLKAKLLRRWGGLPWYEGHPDTSPKDYPNKKSFGWIDNVEARADGLYGHVKWTKAGQEMVAEGHYKYFSPVWNAAPAMVAGKPVLRPTELLSVGFTNTPNMPVLPLSNEDLAGPAGNADDDTMKLPNSILTVLGFAEDAKPTEEEIVSAWEKHTASIADLKTKAEGSETAANEAKTASEALANAQTEHATALENAKQANAALTEQLAQSGKDFDAERHERIELIVASAVANGKITKADADKWRADLKEDFAGKSVELANSKPVLDNTVHTKDLGRQQASLEQGSSPGDQAKALANEKVTKQGVSFDAAWQAVKKERPDLFSGMQQPKTQ